MVSVCAWLLRFRPATLTLRLRVTSPSCSRRNVDVRGREQVRRVGRILCDARRDDVSKASMEGERWDRHRGSPHRVGYIHVTRRAGSLADVSFFDAGDVSPERPRQVLREALVKLKEEYGADTTSRCWPNVMDPFRGSIFWQIGSETEFSLHAGHRRAWLSFSSFKAELHLAGRHGRPCGRFDSVEVF